MTKIAHSLTLLLVAVLASVSALAQSADRKLAPATSAALELGRAYTSDFFRGQLDTLHAEFSEGFKEDMELEELRMFRHQVSEQFGVEKEVISEEIVQRGAYLIYVRISHFAKFEGPVKFMVALRDTRVIAGMTVRPAEDG